MWRLFLDAGKSMTPIRANKHLNGEIKKEQSVSKSLFFLPRK
jgi:oligoendopeptidase F